MSGFSMVPSSQEEKAQRTEKRISDDFKNFISNLCSHIPNHAGIMDGFLTVNYKDNYFMSFGSSDTSFVKFYSALLAINITSYSSAV